MRIAIDGPGGAGKSTIAKLLAKELGLFYLDTGAMYRSCAWQARESGVDVKDSAAVADLMDKIELGVARGADGLALTLDGRIVGEEIRSPEISRLASDISALPACRSRLTAIQREIGEHCDVVMDGRDIGTVVLPDAEVKIFLTASAAERARRRFLELQEKGRPASLEEVLADLQYRDRQDSERSVAPLKQADDAHLLDTDGLDIPSVVAAIKHVIAEKSGRP